VVRQVDPQRRTDTLAGQPREIADVSQPKDLRDPTVTRRGAMTAGGPGCDPPGMGDDDFNRPHCAEHTWTPEGDVDGQQFLVCAVCPASVLVDGPADGRPRP